MTDLRSVEAAGHTQEPPTPIRSRWLFSGPGGAGAVLVGLCVLFTLALRVPFLTWPLMPDEAGLLIIARNWHEGPFLYGDYFVGRGVVLMLVYALADALGGALALRLLGCLVAAGLVVVAGWAGHQLRGTRGAAWSALVAASYSSTYAFSAQVMNGRLVAATLVTLCCACAVAAVRHPQPWSRTRDALAVLAGVASTCALLVVQSYAGGAVFAGVLLLASWRGRALAGFSAARIAAAGVLGMLLPVVVLAVPIMVSWPTWEQLWFQMFGYRLSATELLGGSADLQRMTELGWVAALSGMLLLFCCFVGSYRLLSRRSELAPVWVAVVAMTVVAAAGMVLGGSWYPDYLLQLVPGLVLATALVAPRPTWSGLGMRAGAVVASVAAVVATFMGLERPMLGTTTNEAAVARWLAADAERDDTAVVLWGKANVLYEAGMTTPYPYLWSLLTRTLDPDLELLLTKLRGPEAPTWVVEWHDLNSWGLDESGNLAEVVADRYVYLGKPCGVDVYLLRSESRELPAAYLCGELGK